MHKLFSALLMIVVIFGFLSCRSQGQENSRTGTPPGSAEQVRPSEQDRSQADPGEAVLMKLDNFLRLEEQIPEMALSEEQKGAVLPLLLEWKEVLDSGKNRDGADFAEAITLILTEEQNAYDPFSFDGNEGQGPRPGGAPPQGMGAPPQGGPGGPPPKGEASPPDGKGSDHILQMLQQLIDQLS